MMRSNVIIARSGEEGKRCSFEFGHEEFSIDLRNEVENMMLKP
jgi:hypothetical protein